MQTKAENVEDGRFGVDSDSPQPGKKCYICLKGFNFRKKLICKLCGNSVCPDHCQRMLSRSPSEDPLQICDLCYKQNIRKDLETELNEDIKSLEEELKQAKFTNDRLEREHFEKTAHVSRLENEVEELAQKYEKILRGLEETLAGEELEAKEVTGLYKESLEKLDKAKKSDIETNEKLKSNERDLENMKKQGQLLKETKESLSHQLDKINSKLKGSLSLEQVNTILCQNCQATVQVASKRRAEAPSILEDATISLNITDDRVSILESVREFKDALTHQNTNPTDNAKCLIM